jgi:hypothetical protein
LRSQVLAVCFFIAFAYSVRKRTEEAIVGVIGVGVGVGLELELELEDESDDEDTFFGLLTDEGFLFSFCLRLRFALLSSSESYSSS